MRRKTVWKAKKIRKKSAWIFWDYFDHSSSLIKSPSFTFSFLTIFSYSSSLEIREDKMHDFLDFHFLVTLRVQNREKMRNFAFFYPYRFFQSWDVFQVNNSQRLITPVLISNCAQDLFTGFERCLIEHEENIFWNLQKSIKKIFQFFLPNLYRF